MTERSRLIGKLGEQLACEFLERRGWRIIGQNIHSGHGEIDIIAVAGDVLIFVEVKTRTLSMHGEYGDGIAAAHEYKQRHIRAAVNRYLTEHDCWNFEPRIDLVAVDINIAHKDARIRHFCDIA